MSPVLIVFLAVAAPAVEPAMADASASAGRTGQALRDSVHEALRRWARPSDAQARQAASDFLALYGAVDRDDQLTASQREYLRTKLRSRLTSLVQQIAKRAAIERRLARDGQPAGVGLPADRADVLAQQGGFGGGFGPGGFGGGFGPGGFGGGVGVGGGVLGPADQDHGEALVDLIQKTISPASWDINGGNGSIYYWRPGRALVIRQTGEVHGQIGDVLEQMGRLGQ
jgi:hypothetical protein